MGVAYEKAVLLYQQERYELARQELARELAAEPNSARAHAMLALCLAAQEQYAEARRTAERAIALAPQLFFAHYALAWVFFRDVKYTCRRGVMFAVNAVHLRRLRLKNADAAVREAIRLSPHEANLFGLLALIQFDRGDPRGCLQWSRHGLALCLTLGKHYHS
jgi:tetratricopeptide (TPR) repeat protein